MPVSLGTRKPIDRLQPEDLDAFPIWEFALDEEGVEGQDETWVRPLPETTIGPGLYSLSVAADFKTASGVAMTGFVGVTTVKELELDGFSLLYQGKYVFIHRPDYLADRQVAAEMLGMPESKLFPISFTLRVPLHGETSVRQGRFG